MVGSIRALVLTAIATAAVIASLVLVGSAVAAPSRSSCSDLSYLNSAIKVEKRNVSALKLAEKSRWKAALIPANQGLWIAKHSATPCDRDGNDYWLHRQYSIKYSVALVRYLEEMKQGDYDRAEVYWTSVEFWGDEKSDITYAW